jgi:hypothetical protein
MFKLEVDVEDDIVRRSVECSKKCSRQVSVHVEEVSIVGIPVVRDAVNIEGKKG